ncbi:MAG: hypothetical protein JRG70_17440, partial [Deltaproteobacteria bacterium]|nr:hypothetical protein [Deltaproteobacteria bacterium]
QPVLVRYLYAGLQVLDRTLERGVVEVGIDPSHHSAGAVAHEAHDVFHVN